jgi:predicted ribosomally synthesized peptide with SipW-like signal peptide
LVKIIGTLLLILACFGWQVGGSWAYFSDTETSFGNTFTAGVWNNSPTVTVVYPNGGEIFYIFQTVTIEWTATDPDGDLPLTIDIFLSSDGGASWVQIAADEENDGTYDWTIPLDIQPSDETRIRIVAAYPFDVSGQDDSNEDFCLWEATPPPAADEVEP